MPGSGHAKDGLGRGLLYTAGWTVAYVALGFVFVMGLLSMLDRVRAPPGWPPGAGSR